MSNVINFPLSNATATHLVLELDRLVDALGYKPEKEFFDKSVTDTITGLETQLGDALQLAGYALIAIGRDIAYEEQRQKMERV
jgi:hypothetical protein